jgi:hypothetical protein
MGKQNKVSSITKTIPMLVKTLQTQMQQHINKNNNKNAQGKLSHPKLIDARLVEVYELQAAAVDTIRAPTNEATGSNPYAPS